MAGHPFLDSKKKILWVEEDPKYRSDIAVFLEQKGRYEVIARENGFTALEYLRENPRVDLILSDHRMVARGSELARAAIKYGIPIIILTGNFEEAVAALRVYAMKIPVLKKPISPSKLLELLEHYLNGKPLTESPVLSAWWDEQNE
jgi:CheY-like chemotaxis protein